MSNYRDPLAGLKSQVATKRAALESRDAELTPVLRALLPEALRTKLDDLRVRALRDGESMEALADAESALDGALDVHDQAARAAVGLRYCEGEVSDPARPAQPPPWLIEEPYLLQLRDAVVARLASLSERAPAVSRFGDFAYVSRFRRNGVPYSFVIRTGMMTAESTRTPYECWLRTTVPESLPSLALRRQGPRHVVGKALHLAHEHEVGDSSFDALFWITGAVETTAVLTVHVRRALVELAQRHPVLFVGEGLMTLSWSGTWGPEPTDLLPYAALDVLGRIRLAIETG